MFVCLFTPPPPLTQTRLQTLAPGASPSLLPWQPGWFACLGRAGKQTFRSVSPSDPLSPGGNIDQLKSSCQTTQGKELFYFYDNSAPQRQTAVTAYLKSKKVSSYCYLSCCMSEVRSRNLSLFKLAVTTVFICDVLFISHGLKHIYIYLCSYVFECSQLHLNIDQLQSSCHGNFYQTDDDGLKNKQK